MSFPRYPAYKDSGIEWLGEVPAEWTIKRLMHVCDFESGKAHEPFIDDDGEFVCVTSRFVSTAGEARKYCTTNLSPARKDDILMVMSDLPNGRALGRAYFVNDDSPYAVNQRVCIISAREVNPRFAFFLLDRSLGFLQHDDGMNQTHLSTATFRQFPMLIPSTSEQEQITAFLDRETAKIDSLVAEQEQLITLLKEKRQAVISHAVTKGLDPSVPMKDSGVEWLGEVPAHWQVNRLQRVVKPGTSVTYGIVQAGPDFADGIPYIRTSDMAGDELPLDGYPKTSPEIDASYARSKVSVGDLVIAIRATVGKCLPVPKELDGANLTQGTARIAPGPETDPGYLLAFINGNGAQTYFDRMAKGATFREITLEVLRKTPILVPPLDEQCQIALWVTQQSDQFLELIREAEHSQVLLKERRSALISAAVTGQIDVRGLAPEQEQAA